MVQKLILYKKCEYFSKKKYKYSTSVSNYSIFFNKCEGEVSQISPLSLERRGGLVFDRLSPQTKIDLQYLKNFDIEARGGGDLGKILRVR